MKTEKVELRLNKTTLKIARCIMIAGCAKTAREARKWRGHPQGQSLYVFRKQTLVPQLRAMNLAYGFLRGRSLRQVENGARSRPNWDQVLELCVDHADGRDEREVRQQFAEWVDEARLHPSVGPKLPKGQHADACVEYELELID